MLAIVIPSFLIVFAIVVLAVSSGLKYLETRKKKKVTEMLQTAVGDQPPAETRILIEPAKDSAEALARMIGRFKFAKKLEVQIQQAGLTIGVGTLLSLMLVLTIPGALLGLRFQPLMFPWPSALAAAVLFASLPYLYVLRARSKRLAAFEEQFPEALDFLARAMRAGHAFAIALEMLSQESPQPLGQEFRKVYNEHNLGLPIETALTNLTVRTPLLDVRFFVSAVLLQRETGGNLSEILTNLAHVIRERFKLRGQVRAASAHGRITGTILTMMPIALMLGLLAIAPGYLQGMANDKDGRYMIAGVIVAQIIGHFCIRRIVNIKV